MAVSFAQRVAINRELQLLADPQVLYAALLDQRELFKQVSALGNTEVAKVLSTWNNSLARSAKRKEGLKEANEKVALGARLAVLESYKNSGLGKRPSYRYDESSPRLRRFANGAMEQAIVHPRNIYGDDNGLYFVDSAIMDKYAAQWYRLNFGAQPKGSKASNVGPPMRFFEEQTSVRVDFGNLPPSPPFRVPQNGLGFWSNKFAAKSAGTTITPIKRGSIGQGALYLAGSGVVTAGRKGQRKAKPFKPVMSRGIWGVRYLDAGARYINKHYPEAVTTAVLEWEIKARNSIKK